MSFQFSKETRGYRLLTDQGIVTIHNATMDLMGQYGVRIFGTEAKKIYEEAGCDVDWESNMVKFPRELVEWAIEVTSPCAAVTLRTILFSVTEPFPLPVLARGCRCSISKREKSAIQTQRT